jgi:hypothetical protein
MPRVSENDKYIRAEPIKGFFAGFHEGAFVGAARTSDGDEEEQDDDDDEEEYNDKNEEEEDEDLQEEVESDASAAYERIVDSIKSDPYAKQEHLADALQFIQGYVQNINTSVPSHLNNLGKDKGLEKWVLPMVSTEKVETVPRSKKVKGVDSDTEKEEVLTDELLANRNGLMAMVTVIRDVVDMFVCLGLDIFSPASDSSGKPEVGPTQAIQKWLSTCSMWSFCLPNRLFVLTLYLFARLLPLLPGYFRHDIRRSKPNEDVDRAVMDKVFQGITGEQERAFKKEFTALFVKHCPDRVVHPKLTAKDQVELKGLFMVISLACMCEDIYQPERFQLSRFLVAWWNDKVFENAYHSFATILLGIGDNEVRSNALIPESAALY